MAVVVDSIKEVRQYLDESGMDVAHGRFGNRVYRLVLALPNGQYLIVEG